MLLISKVFYILWVFIIDYGVHRKDTFIHYFHMDNTVSYLSKDHICYVLHFEYRLITEILQI